MSVQARDRKIELWYNKIRYGEIKLPRFQRHEAWEKSRISSLLNTILHDLPLGITLILEVDQEQFISRYLSSAEYTVPPFPKVNEHLLDGQQRLTAIWRVLHNNYEWEKYFLYYKEYDTEWNTDSPGEDEEQGLNTNTLVYCQSRWIGKRKGNKMPVWADDPKDCLKRGCIPFELLKPEDISSEITNWINIALEDKKPSSGVPDFECLYEKYTEEKQKLVTLINKYREVIKHYNLPYLALPSTTSKDTALNVFINMNTNSKPLTQYDIIVAEIEGLKDTSLHKLQEELNSTNPAISRYFDLSYLILYTSALMQEKVPNKVGIWNMNKEKVVENWDLMVKGLTKMANFMEQNKIYDEERLPTNAVLSVIAALYTNIPDTGDQAGRANILLKKYLWSSFFTDRYENSAASRAYADYIALLGTILNRTKPNTTIKYVENDVPALNRSLFPLASEEQLLNVAWPKSVSIRGRGILAVANYFNAFDFADGSIITASNVTKREYHHIFPDALIKEAVDFLKEDINSTIALNCALITGKTNRTIGRKEPLTYLKDRYNWASETIIQQRLNSHAIPIEELKAGGYEGLDETSKANKIKTDYQNFLQKRAALIIKAVNKLTQGEDINVTDIFS